MTQQLNAIYRLVLRHQLTRNRVIVFVLLTGLALLLGLTVIRGEPDHNSLAVDVVVAFGMQLIIPVVCLLLASAALGDWVDDETMVYVWLRPVPRWVIALASYLAVLTVALPVNLIPLLGVAVAGGADDSAVYTGTLAATVLATIGYCSLFLLLGLLVRRALPFGLIYIFVWESVVVGLFSSAARLSVGSYAATALARITELDLEFAGLSSGYFTRAAWATWLIPIVIAAGGVALTSLRLSRANVA